MVLPKVWELGWALTLGKEVDGRLRERLSPRAELNSQWLRR